MISHEYRLIFVHVPKTAGTSVEAALGEHRTGEAQWGAQDHRTLRQLQFPHLGRPAVSIENAAELARAAKARLRPANHGANRLTVSRDQYRSYLKFTVVRNPWDRAWSWYRNVTTDPGHREQLGITTGVGFADLLAEQLGRGMMRPQTYWLRDFGGRLGVDRVCRFEDIDRTVGDVLGEAGVPGRALPHLNPGTRAPAWTEAYDERARRLVGERFAEEIDLFGYRFDG